MQRIISRAQSVARSSWPGHALYLQGLTFLCFLALSCPRTEAGEKTTINDLILDLQDESATVRVRAARKLGWRDEDPGAAIPALVKALKDEDEGVRAEAAQALGLRGAAARSAVPALVKALGDKYEKVGVEAACAIRGIEGKRCVRFLEKPLLSDGSPTVRLVIVNLLRDTAPSDDRAIACLVKTLKNQDRDYWNAHEAARVALLHYSRAAAVPALLKLAEDRQAKLDSRLDALDVLRRIGPQAKKAASRLTALLEEKDEALLFVTVEALGCIEAESRIAIKPLTALAGKTSSLSVQTAIAAAVHAIDRENRLPLRLVCTALKQGSSRDRQQGADVAREMGPDASPLVPELVEALKDPSSRTRLAAVHALESIGAGARSAIPALQAMRGFSPPFLKEAIDSAIENIAQPDGK